MKKKETYELEVWDIIRVLSRRFIEYDEIFKARVINVKYEQAFDEWDYEWIVYTVQVNCKEWCIYDMDEDFRYLRCNEIYKEVHQTDIYHDRDKWFINEQEAIDILKEKKKDNIENGIQRATLELEHLNKALNNFDENIQRQIKEAEDNEFSLYF